MQLLCTICSDLVNQSENLHVTKCGHIFHYHCLSQWLERSQSCPQCRNKVTASGMFRLYPTVSERPEADAATLQSRLDDAELHLRNTKTHTKSLEDQITVLLSSLKKNEEMLANKENKLVRREVEVSALREQLAGARLQEQLMEKLQDENQYLQKKMELLQGLQQVLNASNDEVQQMVESYADLRTVATFATALKRALSESEKKKNSCREELQLTRQQLAAERSDAARLREELNKAQDKMKNLRQKLKEKGQVDKAGPEQSKKDEEPLNKRAKINTSAPLFSDNSFASEGDITFSPVRGASNSPYLQLRRGSLALAALRIPPSELAVINTAKLPKTTGRGGGGEARPRAPGSIFSEKKELRVEGERDSERYRREGDVAYDGLGGHARADTFPSPSPRALPAATSAPYLPRPGAKHRLKKPNGGNTIHKMFNIPH